MGSEERQVHLVVDGYGGDPAKLKDEELIRRFLDEYPDAIGMTKMIPPQVYTYHGQRPEDWGISGFVLIAESHISVHTFPDRGYINIDIFSCKEFDPTASLRDVEETFSLPQVRVWTMERGLDYSTPRAAYHGMVGERVNLIPARDQADV
jgi:S-adenosylmethionine decarboxylase